MTRSRCNARRSPPPGWHGSGSGRALAAVMGRTTFPVCRWPNFGHRGIPPESKESLFSGDTLKCGSASLAFDSRFKMPLPWPAFS